MNSFESFRSEVEAVLADRPVGLFSDIDGTLSRIAPTPEAATVEPECRSALDRLAAKLDLVAVVTGRPAADAAVLVGLPNVTYIGNHGLEVLRDGRMTVAAAARPYLETLADAIEGLTARDLDEGVFVEDKRLTASIHFRLSQHPAEARERIFEAIQAVPQTQNLAITEGRMVIELRPPVKLNKGTAVMAEIAKHGLASAIYLGDDLTDLDAMLALREWRQTTSRAKALLVAVSGAEGPTAVREAADIVLPDVGTVCEFLDWLGEVAA